MHKITKLLGLAASVAILGAAAPAFADDLNVGIILGFTGPLEALSPPMEAAAQLAVSGINEQGGVAGKQLKLISGDDGCIDSALATAAGDKLVNTDGVVALIGAMCSGVTIAVANNVGIPSGTVMISPSATAPAVSTLDDKDLVYRTTPSDAYNGQVLAHLLIGKGIKDLGITYLNTDYGKGLAESVANAYTAEGGKVTVSLAHEDSKADYRAELGQIAASGTKNLLIIAYANGSGKTILQQAIESGDFTQFIGGDGMVDDSLLAGIDAAAVEGMIAVRPGTVAGPGTDAFVALATAGGIKVDSTYVPQSYDAAFILALALEKTGGSKDGLAQAVRDVSSAPGEKILPGEWKKAVDLIKAGTDIDYNGAGGENEFDAAGDVPGTVTEMTVKGGHFEEVGTASL